jgi:hypothetical protein
MTNALWSVLGEITFEAGYTYTYVVTGTEGHAVPALQRSRH